LGLATFWATFLQTHLVTLALTKVLLNTQQKDSMDPSMYKNAMPLRIDDRQ
jgi:hypothetical protein